MSLYALNLGQIISTVLGTRVGFFLDCQKKVDSKISVFYMCIPTIMHAISKRHASTRILSAKSSSCQTTSAKCTHFCVTCQSN